MRILNHRRNPMPLVVLADCNGKLGSVCSAAVGGHQASEETDNGGKFHELLQDHALFVPSTFGEFHEGDGYTWSEHNEKKGNKSKHRIDFVALPRLWKGDSTTTKSRVNYDFDMLNKSDDHELVEAEV